MGIYIQYIYITKIVVLVSEPVRGRSRATELPCSKHDVIIIVENIFCILFCVLIVYIEDI